MNRKERNTLIKDWNQRKTLGDLERAEYMAYILKTVVTVARFKQVVEFTLGERDTANYLEMAQAFEDTPIDDWKILGWKAIRATHMHPKKEKNKIRASWRVVIKGGRVVSNEVVAAAYLKFHKPPPKPTATKLKDDIELLLNGYLILADNLRRRGANPDALVSGAIREVVARRLKKRAEKSDAA